MGNINAHDPDYWNTPDDPGDRNLNWMSALSDSTPISDLSVPGTHDSMANSGGTLWVWCQSLTILLQLSIGIRFFDIRCRHFHDGLPIHHGAYYLNANFNDFLQTANAFLQSNPSEVLFVRVKEEYNPAHNTRPFWLTVNKAMDRYPNLFWMDKNTPNIGQVRGKIVLLVDFNTDKTLGIPYSTLYIEDHYKSGGDEKFNYVKGNLKAAQSGPKSNMYLTYNSAATGGEAPREIARKMNPRLHTYVRNVGKARLGIIAIDYPGPKLVKDIIDTN